METPTTEQLAKLNAADAYKTIAAWINANIQGGTTVKAAALTSMRNKRAKLMREQGLNPEE